MVKHVVRLVGVQTCLILFGHSEQHQHVWSLNTMFDRVWTPNISRLVTGKCCLSFYLFPVTYWCEEIRVSEPKPLLKLLLFKTSQGNVLMELPLHSKRTEIVHVQRQITTERKSVI